MCWSFRKLGVADKLNPNWSLSEAEGQFGFNLSFFSNK